MTLGRLGGVMVSTLALNARDVHLIPTLGAIFPIFITPMTLVAMTQNIGSYDPHSVQGMCDVWLLNLPYRQ